MSATTAPTTLDFSGTHKVPLMRLVKVEMRKALDTRAGRWLVIGILALVVVIEVIYAFAAHDDSKGFQDFLQIPGAVLGYFLPIIIIVLPSGFIPASRSFLRSAKLPLSAACIHSAFSSGARVVLC